MSRRSTLTMQVERTDGTVDIDVLARILRVTEADLAASAGISHEEASEEPLRPSEEAQRRFSELVQILARTTPWVGHPRIAFAWYRSQPLPGFGLMTAEDLLKMDRATAVKDYLDRIAVGGYA